MLNALSIALEAGPTSSALADVATLTPIQLIKTRGPHPLQLEAPSKPARSPAAARMVAWLAVACVAGKRGRPIACLHRGLQQEIEAGRHTSSLSACKGMCVLAEAGPRVFPA